VSDGKMAGQAGLKCMCCMGSWFQGVLLRAVSCDEDDKGADKGKDMCG
jgi:hypothetical protein